MEQLLHTSVLYAQNRIIVAFVSAMVEPEFVELRRDERSSSNREAGLRFCVLYDDKEPAEAMYVKRRKFWRLDGVLRIETNSLNATFKRSGIKATILNIEVKNTEDIRIPCLMNHDETTLALNQMPDRMRGYKTTGLRFCPDSDNTGYELSKRITKIDGFCDVYKIKRTWAVIEF